MGWERKELSRDRCAFAGPHDSGAAMLRLSITMRDAMKFVHLSPLRSLRTHRARVAGLLLLASMPSHAADSIRPPAWGSTAQYEQGRRNAEFDDDQIKLGTETLYIGVSTLSGLRKKFGVGRIRDIPGATEDAEREHWLCYTVVGDGQTQRLWLGGSSASVNGPDLLGDYVVEALPAQATATPQCPRLPTHFAPLALDHGVQLDASAADLLATTPSLRHEGDAWVMATSYMNRHYVVFRLWAIRIVDGRIVGVRVHTLVTS